EGYGDPLRLANDRLVDRVVHDLVDEVVQPTRAGRADVHAGPFANGLEALEDGDVLGAVGRSLPPASRLGLRCLGRGALASTVGAGGALSAASSALGALCHSASFQSNQGTP